MFSELSFSKLKDQNTHQTNLKSGALAKVPVQDTVSNRIDEFLLFKKKVLENKKAEERKHRRKMPKWSKNMPAECFMRIMRYMPFRFVFTDYAVLNR